MLSLYFKIHICNTNNIHGQFSIFKKNPQNIENRSASRYPSTSFCYVFLLEKISNIVGIKIFVFHQLLYLNVEGGGGYDSSSSPSCFRLTPRDSVPSSSSSSSDKSSSSTSPGLKSSSSSSSSYHCQKDLHETQ